MLPFGVTFPDTVPQGSEIPEGLMNNPVFTKAELGRKSRKGEVMAVTVKHWHQIACMDIEGGVKRRFEWQKLG